MDDGLDEPEEPYEVHDTDGQAEAELPPSEYTLQAESTAKASPLGVNGEVESETKEQQLARYHSILRREELFSYMYNSKHVNIRGRIPKPPSLRAILEEEAKLECPGIQLKERIRDTLLEPMAENEMTTVGTIKIMLCLPEVLGIDLVEACRLYLFEADDVRRVQLFGDGATIKGALGTQEKLEKVRSRTPDPDPDPDRDPDPDPDPDPDL